MKRKLFVDDIRPAPDETWTLVKTITEAISALNMFEFDIISLDHDISHQVIVGSTSRPYPCEETFVPVAMYIAEKYYNLHHPLKPKIYIHTSNPAGAVRMGSILQDFEVIRKEAGFASRINEEEKKQ